MTTPAQAKATAKYIKERTKTFVMRCNLRTDADIVEHLASKDNVAGYLKGLVRADMKQENI